jgi:predicted phage terminase large subunit-like protein
MLSEIEIAEKFEPLFELLDDGAFPEVDTVILTGGRASSKSFNVALLSLIGVVQNTWKVLFSRFTNTSIGDSIKLEVSDKIEMLNYEEYVEDIQHRIKSKINHGFISFKGIKTGSKGQTANLKSLSGFNVFVVDEAEEIPDFETFKKVYYSIRSIDRRNLSILILNPTYRKHWIYKTFFKDKVTDGFCGVKDNVMYIHSSYLDVNPDYIPTNIKKDYERLKESDPDQYDNIVLGGWLNSLEGMLFNEPDLLFYDVLPKEPPICKLTFVDIADEGTDNHSAPIGYIYEDGRIFIVDVLFTKLSFVHNVPMTADIINKHRLDYARVENNYGGSAYILMIEGLVKDTQLFPARATTNKHSRILSSEYTVKRKVYFRADYKEDEQYNNFMECIFDYKKDGGSEHDDAPDSIEGLTTFARGMFPHLY